LLSSPQYAEQRTIRWLDAVRYADTAGFHGDNPIPAWPDRAYVLQAFQTNRVWAVPRLRAAVLSEESAIRRVHARTNRRRPAARRDRPAARRVGLQPSQSDVSRRRAATQGIPRQVRRGPRADAQRGVDGQHARMRRMP